MVEEKKPSESLTEGMHNQVSDQLSNKLQTFYDSQVETSLQRKAMCEQFVYSVVHKVVRKVQTVDSRFRANSLVPLGMPYDGIHGEEPTNFEMMLQLSLGQNNSLYLLCDKSRLSARIQPVSGNVWEDCIESNSVCVSAKLVTRLLRQYVRRSVYVLRKYIDAKRFEKLPEHLESLELDDDRDRIIFRINKTILVRLLPSISVPDCRSDLSRRDIPSSSHVIADCQQYSSKDGASEDASCHTDQNNNESISTGSDISVKQDGAFEDMIRHIDHNNNESVSSDSSVKNTWNSIVWRFSFFVAEKNKLRTISDGCRIKLLRILTEIRDSEPCLQKLSSYHLQTMFFYETDRLHRRREWKETKIASRFLDLLRAISARLQSGVCVNYFMQPPDYPNTNLLKGINASELQQMKEIFDTFLQSPIESLVKYENTGKSILDEK